ncbi:Protein Jade-1 [Phytophthora ramorum]|nr:Protein Jade-1 [Phytophthora ramorum]
MEQRRLAAAESLLAHSLFGFQVHDTAVSERLRDLRELLLATCGERDQIALLSESIREIEEQLQRHCERYLLEPLRRFEQEMELLLDVGSGDEAPQDEEEDDQLTDEDQECWSQEGGSRITPCPSPQAISSPKQEEEVLCGVCCAPDSLENDPIVICDVCGVAVHQTCYRLATVPDGDWYCHPCRQYLDAQDIEKNLIPTHELECEACCAKAGAMSPTVDGKWVHVACSMFLPELYVQDKHAGRFQGPLDDVQVVCGVDKLRPRRKLRCCFCKKTNEKGACAQCAVGKCTVAYHALCALRNGIKLRYMEDRSQFGSGCLKHQAKILTMGGESESEVAVHGSSKSTAENLTTKRSHKKKSWSDEDDSESDEASEDENELDSDSDHDGSEDSVSDGDQHRSKVEDMCGVRLSSNHPEYELVRELLVMPRRERIPVYLVEFRNSRKQKHTFLSSDILMGVSSESKGSDAEVEEKIPLDVGTTVTVAKRTWPGMNKLGGVGRIKKVNEKTLPDGAKRFTYNVVYVMGGKENNVERKWISVVDLDTEEPDKTGEPTGRRQKSEPEPDVKEAADEGAFNIRLSYVVHRGTDEEKLAALPDAQISSPPKRRKFQLQFSTANATVFCERKGNSDEAGYHNDPNVAPAKELLLHRHFDVKLPEIDALTNACFSSELTSLEDRVGDEVDEDDTDSEGEADEIKTELATLQSQFRTVMEANEQALTSLTKKVEEEYAGKGYRQQELQDIQWRNYERMYQELQAAKRQFDDSDGESNEDGDIQVTRSTAGKRKNGDRDGEEDSEDEDISFGGMFVNKLKQEGSEVCALCELSGGDFTGTDNGTVVHPQCAMFTPETFFKDGVVHGIQLVDPERRQLKCSICGGRKGMSKVQCANRKCVQAFHVACAFVNGLLTKDPYYQAWCPRHLKTSGMGQFVELPGHLHKQDDVAANVSDTPSATPASSPARRNRKSSKQRRSRKKNSRRQETTPGEASTAPRAAISSSKTNKKRRRKDSNADVSTIASSAKSARGNRGGSPRSAIVIENLEPRCVRRLEIDELSGDSDHEGKAVEAWQQGRDTNHVFLKNDVVEVLGREWRGINKPGGVARVRGVEMVPNQNGEKDVFYDVNYVLGTYKEKHVAARFIRSYDQSSAE